MRLFPIDQSCGRVSYVVSLLLFSALTVAQTPSCEAEFAVLDDVCYNLENKSFSSIIFVDDLERGRRTPRRVDVFDPQGDLEASVTKPLNNYGDWLHEVQFIDAEPGVYTVRYYCDQDNYIESQFSLNPKPVYFLDLDPIACNGGRGALSVAPARGQQLSYTWSTGEYTETIEDLLPGPYSVTITNQYGCRSIERFDLTEPDPLTLEVSVGAYSCQGNVDSLVILNIKGGRAPYLVDWSYDGMGDYDDEMKQSSMPEGIFQVNVKDALACEREFFVQIIYDQAKSLSRKSTTLEPLMKDNGMYVYNLMLSLDKDHGDLDNDGKDGSLLDVSFYTDSSDAVSATDEVGDMYLTSSQEVIYARLETEEGCFVVSEVQLNGIDFCLLQSEACENDPPVLLIPTECDIASTPLPIGGDYEIFRIEGVDRIPVPELITCDAMTGECYLDPTDNPGSYEVRYSFVQNGSTQMRIGLFGIQEVNPQILIGFDSICANYPAFGIRVNPMGGHLQGPGIVDSLISGSNQIYFVDPTLLDSSQWNVYDYFYSARNASGLICTKTAKDSLYGLEPVSVDIQVIQTEVCSLSMFNLVASSISGPVERIEWTDPDGILIGTSEDLNHPATKEGFYQVKVIGNNGCLDSARAMIDILELPTLSCGISSAVSCPGGSDAAAELEILGAPTGSGYTIAWSNGGTGLVQTGLTAGNYSVTVTAPNGCVDSCNVIITEPDVLDIECSFILSPVTCSGGSDGVDSVVVSGGTPPYRYSIDGLTYQTSNVLRGLSGGRQFVYVLDANDCLDSCELNMPEPPTFSCDSRTVASVSCNGTSTGMVEVFPIGGTPPYSFLWNTGSTEPRLQNMPAGTYMVQVTDANDCICSSEVTISEPPPLVPTCTPNDTVNCFGDTNGVLSARAVGGTPPYTYLWSNGQIGATAIGLAAGDYTVTVRDALGCENICNVSVIQPDPLMLTCVDDMIDCHGASDGQVEVIPEGGTPPYNISWSSGGRGLVESGLPAGDYIATVTDAKGCMAVCTAQVSQPLMISIDLERDSVCLDFKQTITSKVNGGLPPYTYSWQLLDSGETKAGMGNLEDPDQPELTFNSFDLAPGTVRLGLQIEDARGCFAFAEVDFEIRCCFDLAIRKTVDQPLDYNPGDTVEFDIEVMNQGEVDAYEVTVVDSGEMALVLDPSLNTFEMTGNQTDWVPVFGPMYETRIDHIPAGQSHFLKVFMVIDENFTGFQLRNFTEITFYTNGIKDLPMDEDDLSPRVEAQERDDDADDDFNGGQDNPFDEDKRDFEDIFLCDKEPFACNDLVHVSLDENGQVVITPDMLAEGLLSAAFIQVSIKDDNGKELGTNLDCSHVGQLLEYSMANSCDGTSCWGNLLVEDKMPPVVICALPDTFYCHEAPNLLRADSVWDNCMVFTEEVLSDEMVKWPCDSTFSGKRTILRRYVDQYGNASETCVKEIYFKRYTPQDIVFPNDTIIPCESFVSADPMILGPPHVNGTPVYPMDASCSVGLKFKDDTLRSCGATFKIIRKWTAIDWCPLNGQNVRYHTQVIKTIDEDGPILYCPGTDVVVDTFPADEKCEGTFILPEPKRLLPGQPILDSAHVYVISECSDFTYEVRHVPAEDPSNCDPADVIPSADQIRVLPDGRVEAFDLPFGCNWFYYTITDACGNETECTFDIYVADQTPPVAICDRHTVVSLTVDGAAELKATSLDNGSLDNCSIDTMLARRMDGDPCGGTAELSDRVVFCCEDLDDTVMVEFVVFDEAGNSNSCMVEVVVQNKTAPILLDCAPDITLDCKEDILDLSITGSASFQGVCPIEVTYDDVDLRNDCGVGEVRRTWTATYLDRRAATTCVQVISLVDNNPITYDSINWPAEYVEVSDTCMLDPDPVITGSPEINEFGCSDILITYDDQVLVREAGSCQKLLRTWTVVDWCTFDINTKAGQWDFEQTIVIKNEVPPSLACSDTTVYVTTDACSMTFEMVGRGSDDCTSDGKLQWRIDLDLMADGSIEESHAGKTLMADLPLGRHRVTYTVIDGCDNASTCSELWTVEDGKAPSPVCKSGLVTVVMPSTGNVIIWASDLEEKSFDNCTDYEDLYFSFSSTIGDSSMVLTCDDIENGVVDTIEIQLWVTDWAGNQDFCVTTVILQDNQGDVCQDKGTSIISGQIMTASSVPVQNVTLNFQGLSQGQRAETNSKEDGSYIFEAPGFVSGSLFPSKNDDHLAGVSTKDLLLIQYHLLGKRSFESAYDFVAGDVDNNQRLSVGDLLALRKLILGVHSDFPNGQNSWRFHLAGEDLDINAPYDLQEEVFVEDQTSRDYDFDAIKIGDLDGSYDGLGGMGTRTSDPMVFNSRATENGIEILATEDMMISGVQMEFEVQNGTLLASGSLDVDDSEWVENSGLLRISWSRSEAQDVREGDILFTLEMTSDQLALSSTFTHEAYDSGLSTYSLRVEPVLGGFTLYQNIPNPFDHSTIIPFSLRSPGEAILSIFNAEGRLIQEIKGYYGRGDHEIFISSQSLNATGVMYYRLECGDQSEIRKMIRLRG